MSKPPAPTKAEQSPESLATADAVADLFRKALLHHARSRATRAGASTVSDSDVVAEIEQAAESVGISVKLVAVLGVDRLVAMATQVGKANA